LKSAVSETRVSETWFENMVREVHTRQICEHLPQHQVLARSRFQQQIEAPGKGVRASYRATRISRLEREVRKSRLQ
jgi:hypothetical protein